MNKENIAVWVDRDTHTAIKTSAAQAGLTIKKYLALLFAGDDKFDIWEFNDFFEVEYSKINPDVLDDDLRDKYNDWLTQIDYQMVAVFAVKFTGDKNLGHKLAKEFCLTMGIPVE